jgi:hypothetical protein
MPVIQPITSSSGSFPYVPNTRTLTINGVAYDLSADRSWTISTSGTGTVTSVALSATMPTGLVASISGSPITSNGTLGLTVTMQSGYAIPTTAKQTQWDSAYSFTSTFPTGTAQQLLRYNTLGTALEFFTPSYLVAGDIIATTPLVWNSTTKTMSIPAATSSVNGYLSSTDWITFSSKQPAITLTTTGNNGSATLIGATLNIPTYTLVGLGGMSNPFTTGIGQMIYSNGAGAPLSLAPNTSTTKKYLSMTGDGTNGDAPFWDTISTGVSGTTNYIAKFTSSTTIGNSLIYDDGTNVGIGTTSAAGKFEIKSSASSYTTAPAITFTDNAGVSDSRWIAGNIATTYGAFNIAVAASASSTSYTPVITALQNGNVGIGATSPTEKLHVVGNGYFNSSSTTILTTNSSNSTGNTSLQINALGSAKGLIGYGTYLTTDGGVAIRTASSTPFTIAIGGSIPTVTVATTGNVGINTPTPAVKLDTQLTTGTGSQLVARFLGGTNANGNAGGIAVGTTQTQAGYIFGEQTSVNSGDLVFGVQSSGAYTERSRIKQSGQLKLNAYTSVASFSGTIAGLLAFDSSGNVITRNNVVDLSLTTTGNSGSATYNTVTGALNIPTYTLAGLGGMANVFTSLGDIVYSNAAGSPLRLTGNTTTTKKFLSQTGDGVSSDAPFWTTISISDVSGAISLTALSASSPLSYNSSTGAFSIQVANVSQNGYLSSSDWSTFNSKQTQITLTTSGSSGASTFNAISGALNIPEYTLAGLGGLSNPMTSLGDMIYGNSAGAPQRLAPNTTTTRKYLSMLGDGTSGAIPTWETINSLTGTGTSGYITYWNGTSSVTASANLVFDATNTRFGLGISTPSVMTHFRAANGATIMRMENSDTIVSIGETIGKIEFYGNDVGAGSGVTAYIDCRATSINGDNAIDIFSGSNGNVVGGVSVLPSGAVNFTPISTPATAAAGDVYYDSSTNKLRCYDGTSWNDLF